MMLHDAQWNASQAQPCSGAEVEQSRAWLTSIPGRPGLSAISSAWPKLGTRIAATGVNVPTFRLPTMLCLNLQQKNMTFPLPTHSFHSFYQPVPGDACICSVCVCVYACVRECVCGVRMCVHACVCVCVVGLCLCECACVIESVMLVFVSAPGCYKMRCHKESIIIIITLKQLTDLCLLP